MQKIYFLTFISSKIKSNIENPEIPAIINANDP